VWWPCTDGAIYHISLILVIMEWLGIREAHRLLCSVDTTSYPRMGCTSLLLVSVVVAIRGSMSCTPLWKYHAQYVMPDGHDCTSCTGGSTNACMGILPAIIGTQISREWWNLWNYESSNLGSTISGEQVVGPPTGVAQVVAPMHPCTHVQC
jgi:hypothetical protein